MCRLVIAAAVAASVLGCTERRSPEPVRPRAEPPAAPDNRYVVASVANLRARPEAAAELLTQLPIGSAAEVVETRGEWLRVKTADGRDGWLAAALLGPERLTLEVALRRFDETPASDLALRRVWAERAAAIEPGHVPALERLVGVLTQLDDARALRVASAGLVTARAEAAMVACAAAESLQLELAPQAELLREGDLAPEDDSDACAGTVHYRIFRIGRIRKPPCEGVGLLDVLTSGGDECSKESRRYINFEEPRAPTDYAPFRLSRFLEPSETEIIPLPLLSDGSAADHSLARLGLNVRAPSPFSDPRLTAPVEITIGPRRTLRRVGVMRGPGPPWQGATYHSLGRGRTIFRPEPMRFELELADGVRFAYAPDLDGLKDGIARSEAALTTTVATDSAYAYGGEWNDEAALRPRGRLLRNGDPLLAPHPDAAAYRRMFDAFKRGVEQFNAAEVYVTPTGGFTSDKTRGRRLETGSLEAFKAAAPVLVWKDPFGIAHGFYNERFLVPEFAEPLIYVYSDKPVDVRVRVDPSIALIVSVPDHGDEGWKVRTRGDGRLAIDGKIFRSLFWEGRGPYLPQTDGGFVVAREDVASFLGETVRTLGLLGAEADDFVGYWAPRMTGAPYYRIQFLDRALLDRVAPLRIEPAPDVLIRVHMDYTPLWRRVSTKPTVFGPRPQRGGLVVVEWSGMRR